MGILCSLPSLMKSRLAYFVLTLQVAGKSWFEDCSLGIRGVFTACGTFDSVLMARVTPTATGRRCLICTLPKDCTEEATASPLLTGDPSSTGPANWETQADVSNEIVFSLDEISARSVRHSPGLPVPISICKSHFEPLLSARDFPLPLAVLVCSQKELIRDPRQLAQRHVGAGLKLFEEKIDTELSRT